MLPGFPVPTDLTVSLLNSLKPSDNKSHLVNSSLWMKITLNVCLEWLFAEQLCTSKKHVHKILPKSELCACQTLSLFISGAPKTCQKISLIS